MSSANLDRTCALVAIDLQKGIVAMQTTPPSHEVVARSAELAKAFRARGLPVVWVNVAGRAPGRTAANRPAGARGPDWADLVAELGVEPADHLVTKMQSGGFHGTSLDQYLRRRGVSQIVFVGIATSNGVEATARQAYDLGYNVLFVSDAMADGSAEMHHHSVGKVFPRIGELASTAEILDALKGA